MNKSNKQNLGLETLLEMGGEIFPMDNGYWTKIEAKLVASNEHIPHGIKYSLTLHDLHNVRILGYDNSHGIKPKRKKYAAKRVVWDQGCSILVLIGIFLHFKSCNYLIISQARSDYLAYLLVLNSPGCGIISTKEKLLNPTNLKMQDSYSKISGLMLKE